MRILTAALLGLLLHTTSCGGSAAAEGRLVVTGSSTVAPLAQEIARRFEAAHPGLRIDVQTGGSSRGVADTRRGIADIGMVSRSLAATEGDLVEHLIAYDEVGLLLHRDNPVRELATHQVAAIFDGRVRNWRELGGPDAKVVVVHKADGRATQRVFLDFLGMPASAVRADIVVGDNEQGIKTVAGNRWAVGYVSLGAAEHNSALGTPVRAIRLGTPTARPTRPLHFVTRGPPAGTARVFLEFARSTAVNDLIRALHFAPRPL